MDLENMSLDAEDMSGELLRIKYVRLQILEELIGQGKILFDENPKKHDLGAIAQSIKENGFVDPPKWDTNLNDGEGGLVYGNGRTASGIQVLIRMFLEGDKPPKAIGVDKNGDWYVPIKFGADADSELAAKRFAIDHNNLTMAGGDFTPADMMRMWESDGYLKLATELVENEAPPITLDGDDLDLLIKLADTNSDFVYQNAVENEEPDWENSLSNLPNGDRTTMSSMTFTLSNEQVEQITAAMEIAKGMGEFDISINQNANGNALSRICEIFITNYGKS